MEQDQLEFQRYELSKADFNITLHEKSNQIGGLARTMEFSDAKFDVGPHRFFTYNKEVENLYLKILDKDAIEVKRLTRILYNNKLFKYPLSPFGTIIKIGFIGAVKILASYVYSLFQKYLLKKNLKTSRNGFN